IILICIFISLTILCFADTINVPEDQSTIQNGINAAVDGDTVLVQPGIYLENINFSGKNIRLTSLYSTMQDTSFISGTVIDGYQAGSVVTIISGENSDAVLSGFTITNGNSTTYGAGIYIENSAPSLENLIVSNNTSNWGGAGIYCEQSTVTVTDSWIIGNVTDSNGGGIKVWNSTLYLDNSLLTDNQANGYGGGAIHVGQSDVTVNNSIFRDNLANGSGGAILSDTMYLVDISDTEFCYNTASLYGGALMSFNCDIVLNRVTLHHNTGNEGGAIYDFYSDIVIQSCTIADNQALESASAIGMASGNHLVLLNTIVYDNPGVSWTCEVDGVILAAFCDIEDYEQFVFIEPLDNVIDENPSFIDHPLCDYYLRQDSPCHDSGIDWYHFIAGDFDIELSVEEYMGIMPDMGAYEYYEVSDDTDVTIPSAILQLSCYPNPFNPETRFNFHLNEPEYVDLQIYNLKGQLIKVLCSKSLSAGEHYLSWNGSNSKDQKVASGIYLAILSAGNKQSATKLVLIK
ncbi:MAG: T9SS type A sorting domain-containing protein, partial [Candidatus Cloacimonetes bacterium]|nr:T9SS type A sorting domain-containing protein [Candidatus Cloacimonadota bacterium]